MIRHVWLDFSETLARIKEERHDRLRYETYAEVTGRPLDEGLKAEYEGLYAAAQNSNGAVFKSLGAPSGFWSDRVNAVPPAELYELADQDIPMVLREMRRLVPISLFSNIKLDGVLPHLGIDPAWFTHVIHSGMLQEPKPALEGFRLMVTMSAVPAGEILYIGDHVGKDVMPAKQAGIRAGLMWKQSPEADYSFPTFAAILSLIRSQTA